MIALTVDDERIMLNALTAAVKASPDIESVTEFTSCNAALEWALNNPVDIAFLDISMRGMGGMALAEKISAARPDCRIVFCTGFSEYAVDAFKIHVSGYLLKPITAADVQKEIDHIKGVTSGSKLITARCFGLFDVFSNGKPLAFRRTRTKELLAFLIDCKGAGATGREICAALWEDGDDRKNMNYLYQLFEDLRGALKAIGAEHILIKNGNSYSVDITLIDCDYYSYLETGKPAFGGRYMAQYSWAEETFAWLAAR